MDPDIFHLMILLLAAIQSCTGFGFHHYRTIEKQDNSPKSISRPDRDVDNNVAHWKVYPHWGKRKRSGIHANSEKIFRKSKRFQNAFLPWILPIVSKALPQDDVFQRTLASVVKKPFFLHALDSLPLLYDNSMKDVSLNPESSNKNPKYLTSLSDRSENLVQSPPLTMLSSHPSPNFDQTFPNDENLPTEGFLSSDRYNIDPSSQNTENQIFLDSNSEDILQNNIPSQRTQTYSNRNGETSEEKFNDILKVIEAENEKTNPIGTSSLYTNMLPSDPPPFKQGLHNRMPNDAFQNQISDVGNDFFVVENGVMDTRTIDTSAQGSKWSQTNSYFVVQEQPLQNSMSNDVSNLDSLELQMLDDRSQGDGILPDSFTDLKGNSIDKSVLDILNDPNWDGKFGDFPVPEKIEGPFKPGFYPSFRPSNMDFHPSINSLEWMNDKSKCEGVESRTCVNDADCSCNGHYCINSICSTVSSSDNQHFPETPSESGDIFMWGEPIPTE